MAESGTLEIFSSSAAAMITDALAEPTIAADGTPTFSAACYSRFFRSWVRYRALHSLLYFAMRSFFSRASYFFRSSSLRLLISGKFS